MGPSRKVPSYLGAGERESWGALVAEAGLACQARGVLWGRFRFLRTGAVTHHVSSGS